jgi:hypothetical protein
MHRKAFPSRLRTRSVPGTGATCFEFSMPGCTTTGGKIAIAPSESHLRIRGTPTSNRPAHRRGIPAPSCSTFFAQATSQTRPTSSCRCSACRPLRSTRSATASIRPTAILFGAAARRPSNRVLIPSSIQLRWTETRSAVRCAIWPLVADRGSQAGADDTVLRAQSDEQMSRGNAIGRPTGGRSLCRRPCPDRRQMLGALQPRSGSNEELFLPQRPREFHHVRKTRRSLVQSSGANARWDARH